MAHWDAAGGGLGRFQPIVTPDSYPGNHYDSTTGIDLEEGDKLGFADRFWGRGTDAPHSTGQSLQLDLALMLMFADFIVYQSPTIAKAHIIQSPVCSMCKLPKLEAHHDEACTLPRLRSIDGVRSSCSCPDIGMPDDTKVAGSHFSRRHSSLWENPLSSGLDVLCEEDDRSGTIWENAVRAPIAVAFQAENMPKGGLSIDAMEGHAGGEDEDLRIVKGGWALRSRGNSKSLSETPIFRADM